ncbi:MAG: hypothetical protein JWQ76_2283 [Ramlibacter sp.]|nr:hypothetical protein [Ramlibacter sp.]
MARDSSPPDCRQYEVRFDSLFQPGRALAFPCDREGHLDFERCSARARSNYLFARSMVGREYKWPRVCPCAEPDGQAPDPDGSE